jgi:histidyl-tRNA synthetase
MIKKENLKIPKGTIDLSGDDYLLIDYLKNQAKKLFHRYGGQFLETPIFERKEVLLSKIGQDTQKEIYLIQNSEEKEQLETEGKTKKEELALRFDLTVPLVRYVIENKVEKLKSSRIGKVYRHDDFSHLRLRYREFYQADFDFVGYPYGLPEIESLMMVEEYLDLLEISDYKI